jgi:hypothetical protein
VPPRSSADTRELPGKAKWLLVGAIVLIVLGVLALAAAAFIRQQAPEPAAIQPHPAAQGATAGGGNVEKPQLH